MSISKTKRAKLGWIIGICIWLAAGFAIYYQANRPIALPDIGEPVGDGPNIETEVPEDAQD